jgi:hypothetical protein
LVQNPPKTLPKPISHHVIKSFSPPFFRPNPQKQK